jgi:hypothetical protein
MIAYLVLAAAFSLVYAVVLARRDPSEFRRLPRQIFFFCLSFSALDLAFVAANASLELAGLHEDWFGMLAVIGSILAVPAILLAWSQSLILKPGLRPWLGALALHGLAFTALLVLDRCGIWDWR